MYRKNIVNLATESIEFQSGKFFKELTDAIEYIRQSHEKSNGPMYNSGEYDELLQLIKDRTKLSVTLFDGRPGIKNTDLTINHVFYDNDFREYLESFDDFDASGDVRSFLRSMDTKFVKGEVNLKNSTVSGVFTKIPLYLQMPRSTFHRKCILTSAECAAAILHELGHAFTGMEYLSRMVTTNQVLSAMTRACDKSVSDANREIIFAKGAEKLKMTDEQLKAILNTKNKSTVSCVVLDSAIKQSVSELGLNIYDSTSCEQLADQFAARHGAGREAVTGLDKLERDYAGFDFTFPLSILLAYGFIKMLLKCSIATAAASTGIIAGIYLFIAVYFNSKEAASYDTPKVRFNRIKHQNVEQLKDPTISKELKQKLIGDNEEIDKIVKYYNDNLSLIDTITYYTKTSYRNAHKYELLQKDIEAIAGNDLFAESARLSTV